MHMSYHNDARLVPKFAVYAKFGTSRASITVIVTPLMSMLIFRRDDSKPNQV